MTGRQNQQSRLQHPIDGGRSRIVQASLEPLLEEVRAGLGADVALAVYQSFSNEQDICILAGSSSPDLELPLPNEPLAVSHGLERRQPSSTRDLVLASKVRPYRVELAAAMLVPWRDASGRGWLIAGQTPHAWNTGVLDLATARRFAARVRETHELAGLKATNRLQGDVAQAVRFVTEASLASEDVTCLLEAIVLAARTLLGTSVAYISLPEDDPEYFQFSTLLNIRTSEFRRLRVRFGEGLGGFTRQQMQTVRSLNYAADSRLQHAPVTETLNEGILSAMCTPLVGEGGVVGLLYVGNRHLTPFTETDAALMEEFAGYAALGIRHTQAEQFRQTLMRKRENERLAAALHDSVVRSLMQIGFAAEEGMVIPGDPRLRHRFSIISRAAEFCLETLRAQLADLTSDQSRRIGLEELRQLVQRSHWRDSVSLSVQINDEARTRDLPGDVAEAIARIAQEAVTNAQLHGNCNSIHVAVNITSQAVEVIVEDDGRGMSQAEISEALEGRTTHLGLRGMNGAATNVGGRLTIGGSERGGLSIVAILPTSTTRHAA